MEHDRSFIIGTAGHIDHGKTVLVGELTGRNTDRLSEEKERGISIDLGFAPFELSDGRVAGIVDVPGHENFIRNMMSGATGVDMALLVVAADDGVMPQTREHLAILDLLGVDSAVIAVTKADLVEEEMLDLVREEIEELVSGTGLEGSAVVPVSAVHGTGLGELIDEINLQAGLVRLKEESLPPRLPIDRVFTLKGVGTVVTGTLWSGTIANGDRMALLPGDRMVRIRSLQVHDKSRETVYAGERVAANLAGVSTGEVTRGDVLALPGYLEPTYMIDANVRVLDYWTRPLARGKRIRFHHGTRELMGRIYPLGCEKIAPGEERPAQLRLEGEAICVPGDRFVIRSYSPVTTIGGGTVVDAHPGKHKVEDETALREFGLLQKEDPVESASVYLSRSEGPLSLEGLTVQSGLPPATSETALNSLVEDGHAVVVGKGDSRGYVSMGQYGKAAERLRSKLSEFHRSEPLAEGMAKETLRMKALPRWPAAAVDAVIEQMISGGELKSDGKLVALTSASSAPDSEQRMLLEDMLVRIRSGSPSPPTVSELADEFGKDRKLVSELMKLAVREGELAGINPEIYFPADALEGIKKKLTDALSGGGGITVSDFRKLIGTSRKYAVPLLEYFDRNQVTVRVGDERKLR